MPTIGSAAFDRAAMLAVMAPLAQRVHRRAAVRDIVIERLERRLLRYDVELRGERPWRVIGKVYASEAEGRRAFDLLRRLWNAGFQDAPPASVRIPRPYGYRADLRLLLMEEAPGRSLKTLAKKRRARGRDLRWFAAALAKLHQSPFVPGAPLGVEDHLARRCAGLHEPLALAFADLAGAIRGLVARARQLESRHAATPTAVHGDFHLGQVHLHPAGLWILDLDPLHFGDPAYDVAMVFVMLKHLERRLEDAPYVRELRDAFIDEYCSRCGYDAAARVPLHAALIHLKRACKRFRYQDEPDWSTTVRRQIEEATACMDRMAAGGTPRSVREVADLYDGCPATV